MVHVPLSEVVGSMVWIAKQTRPDIVMRFGQSLYFHVNPSQFTARRHECTRVLLMLRRTQDILLNRGSNLGSIRLEF